MAYSTRNNISEQQHNNTNKQTATAQFADKRAHAATQLKQQELMATSPTVRAQSAAANAMKIIIGVNNNWGQSKIKRQA